MGGVFAHNCAEPNLQNIPSAKDTPEGKMARDIFQATPGHVFCELDYSQLELRVAAMLSKDEEMQKIFESGMDYHLRTAQLVSKTAWGISEEEVTEVHRRGAKTINFGLLYGMGDEALAGRIGCDADDAARIREAILGRFYRLASFIDKCLNYTRDEGIAWTFWEGKKARRRPLWHIADRGDEDGGYRSRAENGAFNTPVQGTASEFCVASCVEVVDLIENDGLPAKLCLPIHDALLLEVPEKRVAEVVWEVRRAMTGFYSGKVPLEVDCKVGPSWGSLKAFEKSEWAGK